MRVLVTRPQPGTARTAQRLAGLGHDAVQLPLTKIVAVEVDARTLPPLTGEQSTFPPVVGHPPRAIAITSANALRHAPPHLLATLRALPCHAVGGETAAEARAAGFEDVREGPGSADGMVDEIIRTAGPETEILYLCGRVRLSAFEKRLASAGRTVRAIETYDTLPISYQLAALRQVLDTEPIDAVLLYSAVAAEHFVTLANSENWFGKSTMLCLSPRVADRLAGFGVSRVRVAETPAEDALLSLL